MYVHSSQPLPKSDHWPMSLSPPTICPAPHRPEGPGPGLADGPSSVHPLLLGAGKWERCTEQGCRSSALTTLCPCSTLMYSVHITMYNSFHTSKAVHALYISSGPAGVWSQVYSQCDYQVSQLFWRREGVCIQENCCHRHWNAEALAAFLRGLRIHW